MSKPLSDKIALVTGGAQESVLASAQELAAQGAKVYSTDVVSRNWMRPSR